MKTLLRIAATGISLLASGWAEETPASSPSAAPVANPAASWSLVYLPDLDWTEAEVKQTVALLQQLKPGLVVSMAPCPFADAIRNLECKPAVLDQTQRAKLGVACGLPANPLSRDQDTSTLHAFGHGESGSPGLVWLSSEDGKNLFNGPRADGVELRSLARMQVRKQMGERRGEVVFLVDPSVPTPADEHWILPRKNVKYEQAGSALTGFTCIRPGSLQREIAAIDGIAPRVPVVHWIHSGAEGMQWEVLPTDGGPAIHHSTASRTSFPGDTFPSPVARLKAPLKPSEVPVWMDDYINNNLALDCGENVRQGAMKRRFGWTDYGVTRDNFHLLRAGDDPAPAGKAKTFDLPRGSVRSPGNLFSITVGQLGEKGFYPEDGDDGVNVYLQDFRQDKSILLYFAGLYAAWPSTATWFTDRYVITSGSAANWLDEIDETDLTPRFHTNTIHLFDLQTGRAFWTASIPRPAEQARPNAPTERIYFPEGLAYTGIGKWRTLWKAVEDGYHAKPEQAPFTAEEVTEFAKRPKESGLQWKDLGTWPPPETWRLAVGTEEENMDYEAPKPVAGGDPLLTYTETADGQRRYTIAISGHLGQEHFFEQDAIANIVAHADLFTTGEGSLPQLETIQRMGERKQHLVLAGTYQKPGGKDPEKGKWMLLVDLLHHRSWSAHW